MQNYVFLIFKKKIEKPYSLIRINKNSVKELQMLKIK